MSETLWLEVTQDEYELPLAVAGNQHELSRMVGVPVSTIRETHSKWLHGKMKTCRYRRVVVQGGESERDGE